MQRKWPKTSIPTLTLLAALAVGGVAIALPHPAEAASFNCVRARSPVEVAICNDPGLGTMDEQMASLYFRLTNSAPGWAARQIKSEQSGWIRQRNACGYDPGCIAAAYDRRINRLYDWQGRLGY